MLSTKQDLIDFPLKAVDGVLTPASLSAREVRKALRRMLDGGDNELALQMAVAAEARHPEDAAITRLKEEAGDRLRSLVQYFDPFKFVTYTEMIGKEHPAIPAQ